MSRPKGLAPGTAPRTLLDLATRHGAAMLDQVVNQQAQIIAYNNDFRLASLTVLPSLAILL